MQMIDKDVVIIGAGPSGLTAGIYASRASLDTLILENDLVGGQMAQSSVIENYPGFESISGLELGEKMRFQAEKFGTVIDEFDSITNITLSNTEKIITTKNKTYNTRTVIICTGALPKKLNVDNEKKFYGKGVHYCALCDSHAYVGMTIAVIGGGNSAFEEALYLSKTARQVIIIKRNDNYVGDMSLFKEVTKTSNIEILSNTEVLSFNGTTSLESICIKSIDTSKESIIEADGAFIYIGREPNTDFLGGRINLTKSGYIITDSNMCTNIAGVYAAGDVREKLYRQVITAASDGAHAALSAKKFISETKLF